MKRFYQTIQTAVLVIEDEGSFMSASQEPVQEVELKVEVDDYITIDSNNISFD